MAKSGWRGRSKDELLTGLEGGAQAGHSQGPVGTLAAMGRRQKVWRPPLHPSQRSSSSPRSPEPHTSQRMLSKTERETGGGASTGSERRMTSEMEQKRRGEGVEGEGAAVRLRRSPGELVGDGAARPMATEVGRAGWEEEEKSGYDYVARLRGLCRVEVPCRQSVTLQLAC
jgi:hypothetical protein